MICQSFGLFFNKRYLQNAAEVLNFLSVFFNNLSLWKGISNILKKSIEIGYEYREWYEETS